MRNSFLLTFMAVVLFGFILFGIQCQKFCVLVNSINSKISEIDFKLYMKEEQDTLQNFTIKEMRKVISLTTEYIKETANPFLSIPEVIQKVLPGVVEVKGQQNFISLGKFTIKGFPQLFGAGFVINKEKGYILTAKHVVEIKDISYQIKINNKELVVEEVYLYPEGDLAILVVDTNNPNYTTITELELSQEISYYGQEVLAFGHPFGYEDTVTIGIISHPRRENGKEIQFDAAVNLGNSGGPLVGLDGRVIGVVVALYCAEKDVVIQNAGINFAVSNKVIFECLEAFEKRNGI